MIDTIKTPTDPCKVTVTIPEFHVQCPYDDHMDSYTISIEWTSRTTSIEYKSLYDTVMEYEGSEIGHEALTTELQNDIDYPVQIEITGRHYGMDVSVTP